MTGVKQGRKTCFRKENRIHGNYAISLGIKDLHILGDSKIKTDLAQKEGTSRNTKLLQIHILSEQLDKEFDTITHQHIKRKYNRRADQLAHAAGISKERGDHYARHPEDQSRVTKLNQPTKISKRH